MRRLFEVNKYDIQEEGVTAQFGLEGYNDVLIYALNTSADTAGDVVINDGAGGDALATLTLAAGEEGYIAVKAEQVTDTDGELELVTPAEALATVIRGEASYKPVTQTVDASEVV